MKKETPNESPNISIVQQYIKNIAFDNTGVTDFILQSNPNNAAPGVNVNVLAESQTISENNFEVSIKANIQATAKDLTIFDLKITYAAIFNIQNVPTQDLRPILLVYCPSIIFPFARRVISDITRDSCFPPLMLDMIDFATLYNNQNAVEGSTNEA